MSSQKRKTLATSDDLQSVSSVDSDADDTQTKSSRMQPKTLATSEDLQSVSSVDSDADDTQTKRSRMQPRTKEEIRAAIQEEVDAYRAEADRRMKDEEAFQKSTKNLSIIKNVVKKFNQDRRKGAKDLEMLWKGVCPGCIDCIAQGDTQAKLERNHELGYLDGSLDAQMIMEYSGSMFEMMKRLDQLESDLQRITNGGSSSHTDGTS